MSGVWSEAWSPRRCSACEREGRPDQHLRIVAIDEGALSSFLVRCPACRFVETRATATGGELREKLFRLKRRARTRVVTLMAFGGVLALTVMGLAVSALAAIQK